MRLFNKAYKMFPENDARVKYYVKQQNTCYIYKPSSNTHTPLK